MATKTWTLTDVDQDLSIDSLCLTPDDVDGQSSGYRVCKRTLQGGSRQGVDVIEVDNGTFRFVVVPTRGMGIWRATQGEVQLGWKSPVRGPVHPALVPLSEPSGLGWLDGFDELLVRCGLESNGAPEFHENGQVRYGLHGKIANIPAHNVKIGIDGDLGEISVTGVVDETRLFFNKLRMTTTYTTQVGQSGFTLVDSIENLSAEPSELELLYHINFGAPFLDPGSKVVLPIAKIAPRDQVAAGNLNEWDTYGPETPGSAEAVFFFELVTVDNGSTQTLLHNSAGDRGVSLKFNKAQFPYFTQWKNRQSIADGYVTGLEPATNFPNTKSFEKTKGRVITMAPGEKRSFEIELEVHTDASSVASASEAVAAIQQGVSPEIFRQPNPEWSS